MTCTEQTPGQQITAALRRYFHIGPRTRQTRKGQAMVEAMLEAIELTREYNAIYAPATQEAFALGKSAVASWRKHVGGYRLPGQQIAALRALSPWNMTALLGEMVDAEITNVGEGERWFAARRHIDIAA
jgi:hypothetical protein